MDSPERKRGRPATDHAPPEAAPGEAGAVSAEGTASGEGGEVTFAPSPSLIHHQLTLKGSWVTGLGEMEDLLEFLVRKGIRPERTVTHRFPLEETGEAYRMFDAGETAGKVVVIP